MTESPESSAKNLRLASMLRYGSAIFSQGLMSGFHFVLNLLLVKLLPVADFGVFALTFVLAILTSSVGNALISTPLCVYAPGAPDDERTRIESVLTTLMTLLLGTAIVVGVLISLSLSHTGDDFHVFIASAMFIVCYLARQYSRSFGYSRFDINSVLWGDIAYVVSGAALLLARNSTGVELSSVDVLTILTIANCIAVLIEVGRLPQPISLMNLKAAINEYMPIWQQARWALIGALTTVVVQQAHSLVVSALKSPADYAPLAAGFVIFGPVRVIFTTIQNVIKPEMALAIAQSRFADAHRQMILSSAFSAIAVLGLIVACYLGWPWIDQYLYSDKYSDSPMQTIVFMWAVITLVAALQNGPFAALQSLKVFKELAKVTVFGSSLSLIAVAIIIALAPIHWSLAGVLIAELFVVAWVVRLVIQRFNNAEACTDNPINA